MNHLSDEFTHSTVENEAAKDSPTVQLVRYLIDAAFEKGRTNIDAITAAMEWLAKADQHMVDADADRENQPLLDEAAPIIAALTYCVPASKSLHSLVINWNDRDAEEGTFGTTVRAWNHAHAEYIARSEMETLEDGGTYFDGEVVDHNVGATWKADDLERALRQLATACEGVADAAADLAAALEGATKLLAEIDAL